MREFLESLTGLYFLDPIFLTLAFLLPFLIWFRRQKNLPEVTFAPFRFVVQQHLVPRSWKRRSLALPFVLEFIAMTAIVLALARPVERIAVDDPKSGMDVVLCLDISSSMAARDMAAGKSRLDVCKGAAARFVAKRKNDRLTVVSFARYPDLICPPTLDHQALLAFLDDLELVSEEGPEDATGIGAALASAARVLANNKGRSGVVILLTDGAENVARAEWPEEIAPFHAAELCLELGLKVYVIAAGKEQTVDSSELRTLATRTEGRFFSADSAYAVDLVYDEIDRLESQRFEVVNFRLEDRLRPFLLLAAALLLCSKILTFTVLEILP